MTKIIKILALVLALLMSSTVFYTMWVAGILIFVLAVYYATKLM